MLPFRMLYTSNVFVTVDDVRQLTEGSAFIADEILVPAGVQVHPSLGPEDARWVRRRLADLHELGALRSWEVEGTNRPELPGQVFTAQHADRVIDRETYSELIELVDERLMEQRHVFLGDDAVQYDGITEIVVGRHTLWRFAVAQALGANRVLVEPRAQGTINQFFSDLDRYQKFESLVLHNLEYRLGLPDVSNLDAKELETCRKLMPDFRGLLLERTEGQYDEANLDAAVERVANEIAEAFLSITAKLEIQSINILGKPRIVPVTGFREGSWDVVQMLFAPVILLKYAKLFFDWRRDSDRLAPLLLLLKLREISAKKSLRSDRVRRSR
jgi:hypothetical protein